MNNRLNNLTNSESFLGFLWILALIGASANLIRSFPGPVEWLDIGAAALAAFHAFAIFTGPKWLRRALGFVWLAILALAIVGIWFVPSGVIGYLVIAIFVSALNAAMLLMDIQHEKHS